MATTDADREVRRVLWIILVLNAAVAAMKLAYGYVSGSVSISADGIHSFADGASNVVALIALGVAARPPDAGHPYGHRKFEVLGSLSIGVMILIGMLGIARRTFAGDRPPLEVGVGGFAVVIITLAINFAVATYESRAGQRLRSALLQADARHTASDVMATLSVLVAFIAERLGFKGGDQGAAIFIMVLIGLASWQIFSTAIDALVDAAPMDPAAIAASTLGVAGVVDCHKVRSRGLPGEVRIDLHVQVRPDISVLDGHRISHAVQAALQDRFPDVVEVVVHTEPASPSQMAAWADRQPPRGEEEDRRNQAPGSIA